AAGNQAHIGGADLIAGKDMSLSGSSVIIDPGHDKRTRDETFEQKKSGLTLALSGAVGGAINNAVNSAQDAKNESDGRLAALQATKSVLSGMQAGQAVALDAADSGNTENPSTNAIGVSASLTTQKSKSEQHVRSDEVTGSTLNAGNNLSITATGKNKGPNSGDIVIAGSQLKAGGDTVLDAKNDILLAGAANTQQTTGKNSSSGGGVGVGIGVGSGGWGISVFANGNSAHGKDKGNGTDWTETTIDSGKTVTIKSGNDTVLDGAQVNGNKIVADVGHDLLMRSQQDNNDYDSKQTSVAGGGSFTFGSMSGSAYMSVNQDKMKSRFDSVAEQTGLYAGDGGFDITVGNHTQLDGAVIASTATADKNRLDTGTLGFSDIHNEADFKTEHVGGAFNTGGSIAGQFASNAANALLAGGGNKGHAEGTTQAAVADGTITIRDKDNQKQDVADLSRDTEHANDSISPIFDKEKEQKRLQEIQLIGEVGSQAADVARTQGDLAGRKAAKDPDSLEEARQQLAKEGKPVTDAAVAERAYNNASSFYGTGGVVQRGLQAVTGALTALAGGGNLAGALAGASAPELANIIGHRSGLSDDEALIAHAVLGGVVASLQGNSAAAGAAGALSGELAARAIKDQMFPGKSNSELSESDKQLISNLATLASGLAGNLTGGNSAGTTAGAQAGKNAVENNALSDIIENKASGMSQEEKYQKAQDALVKATEEFKAQNCAGLSAEACGTKIVAHRDELLAGAASFGVDFVPVVGDIKSYAEAQSALDYLAATIGLLPLVGDVAGETLKLANKALKAGDLEQASKLINTASKQVEDVKALDVGSYKELKAREVVGDGLEHDHIPSFASLRKAKENELGRPLTDAEAKNLYQNATAVEVPKDVHASGPTYGGKNNAAQVKNDAIDLCGAECRDTDALRKNMLERGYEPKLVDDAIQQIKERNRQMGVTK
ncbi:hemagglutinin repeat-containing protein, partial [Scandinavium sp.]|uniref:hemagglutinin repeat-containing protein n=1 Tax=Scandinavium sp. TaxID=2830653 RepID=UPI0028A2696B